MNIEQLDAAAARAALPELVALLQDSVAGGASVGFLPPLGDEQAQAYWRDAIAELPGGGRVLLVARSASALVGSVQLELPAKPNASHRAEVQKLMVHSAARGRGLGRALLAEIERVARSLGRTLLVLDTRQGDAAEQLYRQHGYTAAGVIPQYARSADGTLDPTVFFYRTLEP